MYKKLQNRHIILIISFSLASVSSFLLSWLLFSINSGEFSIWLSNLLMGIGASFLASIFYSIFSGSLRKKYNRLKKEKKIKEDVIFTQYKGIDLGYQNAKEAFDCNDIKELVNWSYYFYEKIESICLMLKNAQTIELKLKKDIKTNEFISSAKEAHDEFLTIIGSNSNEKTYSDKTAHEIANNVEKCYDSYNKLYKSILYLILTDDDIAKFYRNIFRGFPSNNESVKKIKEQLKIRR